LRRSFWVLDLCVAVLCAVFMARVLMSFVFPPSTAEEIDDNPTAVAPVILPAVATPEPRNLDERPIFGQRSLQSAKVAAKSEPPPPPVDKLQESTLRLQLRGIVYSPEPASRRAIIYDTSLRKLGVYAHRDEVSPEVYVVEIWPRRVILDERGNRTYLEWDLEEKPKSKPTVPAAARPSRAPQPASGSRTVQVSREEMMSRADELLALRDVVDVRPYEQNGQVIGLQVNNLGDSPLAKEFGVQEGDVVQSINNVRVTDAASAFEAVEKFSNSSLIRVGIMRNGQRTFMTYRLK